LNEVFLYCQKSKRRKTMNILANDEIEGMKNHPRVRAALERVAKCEKQLAEAQKIFKQAELLEEADLRRAQDRSE
jgi:hypothetical protein